MNKTTIDDAKAVFQLAMIAAYKGEAVSKAVAQSLGMSFDLAKVQKVANELTLEREQAEDALYEEWKSRKSRVLSPVIQSFKALVTALGQRIAHEVSEIKAAITQPPRIAGLGAPARNQSDAPKGPDQERELFKWRLEFIGEDDEEETGLVQLTLRIRTDLPSTASVEFVVLGVNADAFESIANAPSDSKLVASDAIRALWSGSVQTEADSQYVESSFTMPKDLKIVDVDSHYHVPLQQDAQGVWGVILKVMPK
jgi:hypothetical protein